MAKPVSKPTVEAPKVDAPVTEQPNGTDVQTEQTEKVNDAPPDQTTETTVNDAPPADDGTPKPEPKPEPKPDPTSEKLEQLKKDEVAQWEIVKGLLNEGKMGSPELLKANMEIFRLQKEQATELADIKGKIRDAEIQEQKNARVAMVDELITRVGASHDFYNNVYKLAPIVDEEKQTKSQELTDEMNKLSDAIKEQRELIANELLAKFGGNKPSANAANGTTATSAAGKSAEIRQLFIDYRAKGGMSDTEIKKVIEEQHGHARGTVGAVVLAYQREIGEKE